MLRDVGSGWAVVDAWDEGSATIRADTFAPEAVFCVDDSRDDEALNQEKSEENTAVFLDLQFVAVPQWGQV